MRVFWVSASAASVCAIGALFVDAVWFAALLVGYAAAFGVIIAAITEIGRWWKARGGDEGNGRPGTGQTVIAITSRARSPYSQATRS